MFCPRLLALFGENQLCFSELLCRLVYISRQSVRYSRINCWASKLEVPPRHLPGLVIRLVRWQNFIFRWICDHFFNTQLIVAFFFFSFCLNYFDFEFLGRLQELDSHPVNGRTYCWARCCCPHVAVSCLSYLLAFMFRGGSVSICFRMDQGGVRGGVL